MEKAASLLSTFCDACTQMARSLRLEEGNKHRKHRITGCKMTDFQPWPPDPWKEHEVKDTQFRQRTADLSLSASTDASRAMETVSLCSWGTLKSPPRLRQRQNSPRPKLIGAFYQYLTDLSKQLNLAYPLGWGSGWGTVAQRSRKKGGHQSWKDRNSG